MDIHGKKILLIASKFFGYENDIKKELEAQGASVDMVLDRPFNSALMKVVTKTSPLVMQKIVEGYYKLKHAYIFVNNYDILFVIEGITVSKNLLRELKKKK